MSTYVFTPDLMSYDHLQKITVGRKRQELLEEILKKVRTSAENNLPLCLLIIGGRGMGKTHLLRMIYHEAKNTDLGRLVEPVKFSEEEYSIYRLSDFFMRILKGLEVEVKDLGLKGSDEDADAIIDYVVIHLCNRGKKTLLLIDNMHSIFEQLQPRGDLRRLRSIIQEKNPFMIIGTASSILSEVADYGEPFYNFFELRHLEGLSDEEVKELVRRRAKIDGWVDVFERLDEWKCKALNLFTGGNPRLIHMLCDIVKKGTVSEVEEYLSKLLDELTPFYQARMENLPPQQRVIIDKIALAEGPITPTEISARSGMKVSLINAQLKRLYDAGYVEPIKLEKKKVTHYEVKERLFRIWREMRQSFGRGTIKMLTLFLKIWYTSDKLLERFSELHSKSHEIVDSAVGTLDEAIRLIKDSHYFMSALPLGPIKLDTFLCTVLQKLNVGDIDGVKDDIKKLEVETKSYTLNQACVLLAKAFLSAHLEDFGKNKELLAAACKNLEETIKHLKKTDEIELALDWQIHALTGLGKYSEALKKSDYLLALNDKNADAWDTKGYILLSLGRFEEALASYNQALSLEDNYLTLASRAEVLGKLGRYNEAIEEVERALVKRPADLFVLKVKHDILEHMGKCIEGTEVAWKMYDRAKTTNDKYYLRFATYCIALHSIKFFIDKAVEGRLGKARVYLEQLDLVKEHLDRYLKRELQKIVVDAVSELASKRQFDVSEELLARVAELVGDTKALLPLSKALEYIKTKRVGIFEGLHKESRELVISIIEKISPETEIPKEVYETLKD